MIEPSRPSATVGEVRLDRDRQILARRYATARRTIGLVDLALGGLFLLLLLTTGAAVSLRATLFDALHRQIFVVGAFALILMLGLSLATLPLTIASGWKVPRRFLLSTQSFNQWAIDWLKGLALGLTFGVGAVELLYVLLATEPTWWWLIASALYVGFVVLLTNLAPVLLVPVFYRLTPMAPTPLTDRLAALARQVGVQVQGVYRMDLSAKTTAANAALMGIGPTRRIVIGDTLLDRFTPAEIEVVFAHELGHHAHRDIGRLIVTQALLTTVTLFVGGVVLRLLTGPLGFTGPADVASLPAIALILGVAGALSGPVSSGLSRRFERDADEFALRTTRDPRAFIDSMTKLANQNLAEYDPGRWVELLFHDHPSIRHRIEQARAFAVEPGAR